MTKGKMGTKWVVKLRKNLSVSCERDQKNSIDLHNQKSLSLE